MTVVLLVDGTRVLAERSEAPFVRFNINLPALEIRLISGFAAPADLTSSGDTRRLGVLLRGARWIRGEEVFDVPLDSPGFVDGFHPVENHGNGSVRWTSGDAGLPPQAIPAWSGPVVLELNIKEWDGSSLNTMQSPEASLLSRFESLGEDCDFSLTQRQYLVEPPLSLYRWGGAPVGDLIRGLLCRFDGLGDPETTELIWFHEQYFLRTPFVSMHTGCVKEQDDAGRQELLEVGRSTLRILRRKLLKDISRGDRIFVFKSLSGTIDQTQMLALHGALRELGPSALLCVQRTDDPHRAGTAERIAPGLYGGYLDRFLSSTDSREVRLAISAGWLAVCAATLALHTE
ncbi:MAG: hypothetical protein JSS43_22625 [Proteobacteria bacterium]|nr:hypothetical protein [Pseudomonadota bacterium]